MLYSQTTSKRQYQKPFSRFCIGVFQTHNHPNVQKHVHPDTHHLIFRHHHRPLQRKPGRAGMGIGGGGFAFGRWCCLAECPGTQGHQDKDVLMSLYAARMPLTDDPAIYHNIPILLSCTLPKAQPPPPMPIPALPSSPNIFFHFPPKNLLTTIPQPLILSKCACKCITFCVHEIPQNGKTNF